MPGNEFSAEISNEVQRTKQAAKDATECSSIAQNMAFTSNALDVSHQASLAAAAADEAAKQASGAMALATEGDKSATTLDGVRRSADLAEAEQKFAQAAVEAIKKMVESSSEDSKGSVNQDTIEQMKKHLKDASDAATQAENNAKAAMDSVAQAQAKLESLSE